MLTAATRQRVELQCQSQIITAEQASLGVEDVGVDPTAAHVAQIKNAGMAVTTAEIQRFVVPLQRLLAARELPAFVQRVMAMEAPVAQPTLQTVEFLLIQRLLQRVGGVADRLSGSCARWPRAWSDPRFWGRDEPPGAARPMLVSFLLVVLKHLPGLLIAKV